MTARILATAAAGVLALAASPSLASGYGQGVAVPQPGTAATNPCILGTAAPGQCVGPVQITGGVMVQAPSGGVPNAGMMPPPGAVPASVVSGTNAGWQSSGSSYYAASSSSSASSSQVVTSSSVGGTSWSTQSSGEVVTNGVPVQYATSASGWGAPPSTVVAAPAQPAPVVVQSGWAVPPAPPHPGQGVVGPAPGCTQQMIAQRIPCHGEWVYATQPQPVPVHPAPVVVHPAPMPAPMPAPVAPGPQGVAPLPLSFFAGGISNGVGYNTQEQWSYGGGGIAIVGGGTRFSGVGQRTTLTPPPRRPPGHNPPPSHKPCGC